MNIVVLTGAGISQESGLPIFRGPDGLWRGHDPFALATPEAFARDPALVHAFYDARRAALRAPGLRPNAAHLALARLEQRWAAEARGGFLLVTQNVDDLHRRAGSRLVAQMHGRLDRARCGACGRAAPWEGSLSAETPCPACGARGGMRPDVVWFGEDVRHLDAIGPALGACDLFAAIGTSGQVHPAAAFARSVRGRTVELNLEPTGGDGFDEARRGRATELVPAWVEEVLATPRGG